MPVVWFLTRFFRVSSTIVRHSVRIVRRQKSLPPPPIASFPVAGFDETSAQTVLFTLRQAAETDEVQKSCEAALKLETNVESSRAVDLMHQPIVLFFCSIERLLTYGSIR